MSGEESDEARGRRRARPTSMSGEESDEARGRREHTGRVVVTGAGGFLGVAVSRLFEQSGYHVSRLDTRASDGIDLVDVCDPYRLDALLSQDETPQAVIHLAAQGAGDDGLVAGADRHTAAAVRTNVEGFVHVVEAASRAGIPRVVWSSSTTVYGPAAGYPGTVDESAPLRPTTAYGATKSACEFLGPILTERLGTEVVSLRLPMVYGPGRWYGGSQAPLVELVDALRTGEPVEVPVWDGAADWIHVSDAASAVLALVRAAAPRPSYHVLGHRAGLADLARQILVHAGEPGHVQLRTTPGGAPDLPPIDDSLMRDTTGWTPQFPDPARGAATYVSSDPAPASGAPTRNGAIR